MLNFDDPLPSQPRRVLIAGVTGAGKTTLARRIQSQWGLPHTELDSLFHGPNWTPRPTFLHDVRELALGELWVTEWQYTSKGTDQILAPRAQLLIWLDYPYRVVRSRLLRRTTSRHILRTPLWNGNTERGLLHLFDRNPEENVLLWQTRTLHKWTERLPTIQQQHPHLTIVRLRHPRETESWLAAQAEASGVSIAPPKRRSRDK